MAIVEALEHDAPSSSGTHSSFLGGGTFGGGVHCYWFEVCYQVTAPYVLRTTDNSIDSRT